MYSLLRKALSKEDANSLKPGSIIAVRWPVYTHVGLISDQKDEDGYPKVLSNSRRRGSAFEENWKTFSHDRDVFFVAYPSTLPPEKVVENARGRLEKGSYNVIWNNCEHYCASAHGLPRLSPQILRAAGIAGAGMFAVAATLPMVIRKR